MLDVVEPSYNICSDLTQSLERFEGKDGNDFWDFLQVKHREEAMKYSDESKKLLEDVHTRFQSDVNWIFLNETDEQHIMAELKKFHDSAEDILGHFINTYRFHMSQLMHFLWVSRKPTEEVSRRRLFLNDYEEVCLGIWSTFLPAIRRLIKGVEGQMQTLLEIVETSRKAIAVHVPLFYVPVSSPYVVNDLMKLRNAVNSNMPKRLAKYFRKKTDLTIRTIERNLKYFESGLDGYYKHLLNEPLKSDFEMMSLYYDENEVFGSPAKDDEHLINLDLDGANSVFASDKSFVSNITPESKPHGILKLDHKGDMDRAESPATTSDESSIKTTSDTAVSGPGKQPKKKVKTARVSFGHVESSILSSVKTAIAEKYTELITPMETSVTRLSTANIFRIQLKFYEFVKEINEICASFIKSGYMIYKRLN